LSSNIITRESPRFINHDKTMLLPLDSSAQRTLQQSKERELVENKLIPVVTQLMTKIQQRLVKWRWNWHTFGCSRKSHLLSLYTDAVCLFYSHYFIIMQMSFPEVIWPVTSQQSERRSRYKNPTNFYLGKHDRHL
jgi:hypothetical protein